MRSSKSSTRSSASYSLGPSRRTFLTSASLALASLPFTTRSIAALPRALRSSATASQFLPESVPDDALRTFATAAIDAARAAGASYADIRIADMPGMGVTVYPGGRYPSTFGAGGRFAYGIRTIVDGASSFVYGDVPNLDLITKTAKNAVATARGLGRGHALPTELAPAPVVQGMWEAPMVVDPFTVPLEAHWDVLGGYIAMIERVKYAFANETGIGLIWSRETRVFASTEGALQTQRFHRADFDINISSRYWSGFGLTLGGPLRAVGGFELATDPLLHAHLVRRAEEAVRLGSVPTGTVDVGRHDVVVTGEMMGTLLGQSLTPAFETDRALGLETGASGTSYLAPPLAILGTPALSPLLTLVSERTAKTSEHARWDDEGMECAPVTLVEGGRVVDFLTSRTTAPALRSWYEREGRPVRSNGNSITAEPNFNPLPRPGHVTLQAAANGPTLEELCRRVKRGYLLYGASLNMDQQLSSLFAAYTTAFELVNGRVTRKVQGLGLQAATKRLWTRSLKALGGASTIDHRREFVFKAQPAQYVISTTTAPAGLFTDIDVIRVS